MKKLSIIVVVVLSFAATASMARGGRGKRGFGGPGPNPVIAHALLKDAGLSAEQLAKIDKLHDAAQRKVIDLRHDLQLAKLGMRKLMTSYKADRTAVFAQLEKIDAIKLKLKKVRVGLMLDVRGVMTQQQWEKVRLMRAKMKAGRRGMRAMGGGHGCGGMGMGAHGVGMGLDSPDF